MNGVPSIVDGLIDAEAMCPGSEGRQVHFSGNTLKCSSCGRWLPAYPGSFLAPVHAVRANVGHLGEVSASHALRQAARDRRGR